MAIYEMKLPKYEMVKIKSLQPFGTDLIIIPVEVPDLAQSSGENGSSILIPTAHGKSTKNLEDMPLRYGVVHIVGGEVTRYKEGDKVYFHKLAGQDGDTLTGSFMQMSETDVFGLADFEMQEI